MPSLSLKIVRALAKDAKDLARMCYLANNNNQFTPILHASVTEEEQVAFYAGGVRSGIQMAADGWDVAKVVLLDGEKETIVGSGVWFIPGVWNEKGNGEKQDSVDGRDDRTKNSFMAPKWPAGENAARLMGELQRASGVFKQEFVGGDGAEMNSLSVHPDYKRRGIGKMLLDWGLVKVDVAGVMAFAESTPDAKKLYEVCGFREVREAVTELSEYGGDGHLKTSYMVRGVHGADVLGSVLKCHGVPYAMIL